VAYRIAYIAFCIQNNNDGRKLFHELRRLNSLDPEYIQFGCADWFWQRHVNSYVLQVEPYRYKTKDTAIIDFQEALHVEKMRNEVFNHLRKIISKRDG